MSPEAPENGDDATEPFEPNPAEGRPAGPSAPKTRQEPRTVRLTHLVGLVTALIGLVTAALVCWQLFLTPGPSQADGGEATPTVPTIDPVSTTPVSPAAPASTEAAPSAPSDETPSGEPTDGPLPDVTGMHSIDARNHLEGLGFTNVVLFDDDHSWIGAKPEHCTVREQEPQGGGKAPFDTEIKLGYYDDPWSDPDELCT